MLSEKELEAIKPHLSAENAAKLTAENGVELLTEQMVALSKLSIEQNEELKKANELKLDRIEVDPDTLETSVELTETKLSALVDSGSITPAVSKALSAALIGPEGKRNVFALSRKATGGAKPLATLVLDALKDNKPVKLGEKTGSQASGKKIELSRTGEEDAEQQKKIFETMLVGANRGK